MKPWQRTVLLVVLGVLLVGGGMLFFARGRGPQRPPPLTELQVAEHWLACIDCAGPFLKELTQLPPDRQDTVVRFLRSALLQGPDSARSARLEHELLRSWSDDSLYRLRRGEDPPEQSKPAFLARYRQGFRAKWRGRAALALGVIRDDTALAALDSALLLPAVDRGDSAVQRLVKQAQADSSREALEHFP